MNQVIQLDQYNIYLGNLKQPLEAFLSKHIFSKYFILVDDNTKTDCLPLLLAQVPFLQSATVFTIPAGEQHKNLQTCQQLWDNLLAEQADRKALFINLGGGVIGDMGGFVASTFKRGMSFIQIPTTLLAQVDASIGGKLGVDFKQVKNIIGCFNNPLAVFIDPQFLSTLPRRELVSGMAEVCKHALIADAAYWEKITAYPALEAIKWTDIIHPSLLVKRQIVTEDPFEGGRRKVLNFGHTIGHAIESYSLENDVEPLLHGEAIFLGMLVEAYLSTKVLHLSTEKLGLIQSQFAKFYPNLKYKYQDINAILDFMKQDKKNEGQRINFTLLEAIGQSVYNQEVKREWVEEGMRMLLI